MAVALLGGALFFAPEARAQTASPAAAPAAPDPAQAKAHLAEGEKAAKAKDWDAAAREFDASNKAQRSSAALLGLANAYYQQKKLGEAYDAYDDALKTYGRELHSKDRYPAQQRMKELAPKTGALALRVAEPGASVVIDDRAPMESPLPAFVRVTPGPHKIKVTKAGFAAVDRTVDVPAGGKVSEEVSLQVEAKTGKVAATEKTGKVLRVIVDGVDMGATPFEGDVEPGQRTVEGRGQGFAAPAQTVEVTRGKTTTVELVAAPVTAHLEVRTSDNKGFIFLDEKPVAEGTFSADVASGAHLLQVKREGYLPYEKKLELADKQTVAETVTLKREGSQAQDVKEAEGRTLDGVYGGIRLAGSFVTSGYKSTIETNCAGLGAASCTTPTPVGGGISGYVGYQYYPFAIEGLFGGSVDVSQQKAIFDGQKGSDVNPLTASPAREEVFTIARGGGFGAIRARFSYDVSFLRLSAALGVGLAGRYVHLARTTTATDGTQRKNVYDGGGHTYFSPAVSGDASVGFKLSKTFAIALGFDIWAEDAGDQVKTTGSGSEVLVQQGQTPAPLATPPYDIVRGSQVILGPYLGFQFGP